MKKFWLATLIACAFFTACNNTIKVTGKTEDIRETAIGGSRDQHGCLTAAGQTWSELKGACIQVFSEGIRLNPLHTDASDAVISAFVLFSDDKKQCEIFLPTGDVKSALLNQGNKGVYAQGIYQYNAISKTLSINNKEMYKGE